MPTFRMLPLAAAVAALAVALPAGAVQRTFVSTGGNDANAAGNCSLAQPCRQFAAAIGVTDANGEIVVLDSGGYGRVTVNKSVKITAPAGVYAGITVSTAGTNGIDIATGGVNVVLEGLAINGQGGDFGIYLAQGASLRVERCTVTNFTQVGIMAAAPGSLVTVRETTLRGNGTYGFSANGAVRVLLDRVRAEANDTGIRIMSGATAEIVESVAVQNITVGIAVRSAPGATTRVTVDRAVVSDNGGNGLDVYNTAATSSLLVTAARSSFDRNGHFGVVAQNDTGTKVDLTLTDSIVSRNANVGFACLGVAPSTCVATRNVITGNTFEGISVNGGGVLQSRSDNTLSGNNGGGGQTFGTITPLPGI